MPAKTQSKVGVEFVAAVIQTSDLIGQVLLFVKVGCGFSKLPRVGLRHGVANVVNQVRGHFSARHLRLFEVIRLLCLQSLEKGICVCHRVDRACFVKLTRLLKVLILVVGFHLGGALEVIFSESKCLVGRMALL